MSEPLYVVNYDGPYSQVEVAGSWDEGIPFKEAQAECLRLLRRGRDEWALGLRRQKRATLDRPEGWLKEGE